jgi:hypothetical protein
MPSVLPNVANRAFLGYCPDPLGLDSLGDSYAWVPRIPSCAKPVTVPPKELHSHTATPFTSSKLNQLEQPYEGPSEASPGVWGDILQERSISGKKTHTNGRAEEREQAGGTNFL